MWQGFYTVAYDKLVDYGTSLWLVVRYCIVQALYLRYRPRPVVVVKYDTLHVVEVKYSPSHALENCVLSLLDQ